MLGIIAVLNILVLLFKGHPRIQDKFFKLRRIFMWNVFLSYFLGDYPELQLNSMIQMRENNVSSSYAQFSLALTIIIVSPYAILACYFLYVLNRRRQQPQGTQEKYATPAQKWVKVPDSIGIIVEDFRDKNRFSRNFLLIMLFESSLQILVIFFFQESGTTQAILYTIIVVVYVLLAIWKQPYKSRLQMAILLLNQCSKAAMGVMAIVFGINDIFQFISSDVLILLGFILALLIVIVMAMNLVVSALIMINEFYERFKEWRAKRMRDRIKSQSKQANTVPRRNNLVAEQSPCPSHPEDVSLDFQNRSNLQEYQHLQNQSFQEDKSGASLPSIPVHLRNNSTSFK